MRWLKVFAAKFLRNRMQIRNGGINKSQADKWNHLSAIINTRGLVKWDWYRVKGILTIRCHRCAKVIRLGEGERELCDGCEKK